MWSSPSHTYWLSQTRRLASVALLATGVPMVLGCSARAEIPEVVVTQSDVQFAGVPRIPGFTIPTEVNTSFDHPDGFSLPEYFNPELYATEVRVLGGEGMDDLSFVTEMNLTLASRSSEAPQPRVVASYVRDDESAVGSELRLDTDSEADVLEYWGTEEAYYTLGLSSDNLPENAWSIDVVVSFSGRLSIGE